MKTKITIVGAGIAGLSTAIAIRKNNPDIEIEIYESAADIKEVGAGLSLAANAIMAFDQIGLKDKVMSVSNVIHSISILDAKGRRITHTDNLAINKNLNTISSFSVHRADLHRILLEELKDSPIYLHKRVSDFYTEGNATYINFKDGTQTKTDFIIASDGIHSVFRSRLVPDSTIRFAGYTCWRGVADLNLASDQNLKYLNPSEATETWGAGKRFGIVPLKGSLVYWFACINSSSLNDKILASYNKENLIESFKDFHAPITQLIDITPNNKILWNDIIDFVPISQYAFDKILLLGDAAHATTPNLGQGACQAIEDAVVLGKILAKNMGIQASFQLFQEKRIQRASTIVNRSWQLGKIAQWENPILASLRNFSLRCLPESINQTQIKYLLNYQY